MATSAIRFYESKGLLKAGRRQPNGYRDYPPEAVTVLSIISDAQQVGFTLDEIRQILPEGSAPWQHDQLMTALRRKVAEIEAQEASLAQNKAHIQSLIRLIDASPQDMDCKVNAARVMAGMGIGDNP
ncbi:MerR family transcriptional regulator [Paludibacterium paludis]|uniref:MerR family transcriptional regulator n=2 Tax=Paludibacterium paludis TaxID=1225769 RepID=A0A918P5Q4_9NEIS|nr:MerR family transcriptional regulator [Paludibacterium paludis]